MSIEANKAAVRAFFAATVRRDRAALSRLLADDVCWQIPKSAPAPFGGAHRGHARVLELFLAGAETLFAPGTHSVEIELLLAEGDLVAAEVQMRARTVRGSDYCNQYVFLFRFEGDRIAEFREHLDTRYAAPFLDPEA